MASDLNNNGVSSRRLRARSKSRRFSDEMWFVLKDEEDVLGKKPFYTYYNLSDKLTNIKFSDHGFVKKVDGWELNVQYLENNGFNCPLLIEKKHGLGLEVPDSNFDVKDVCKCVGSDRIIDVIDVQSHKDLQMSMKSYQKYYESPVKKKLYNVISLEFSHTKLEKRVVQPSLVRQLDWVDLYWPKSLKSKQMDSTNTMKNMMYPKVQKYCLMSVKGCYTDFHSDFGGSSVWYHILKGQKVFWLISPTDENLLIYRDWLLTDKQLGQKHYMFLGEAVDRCERVVLKEGQTFFIPSGWLHAVYTTKDSLVFGGNFLHSFSTDMQVKIDNLENDTHVMQKFRYPFFTEVHWYALSRMVEQIVSSAPTLDVLTETQNECLDNKTAQTIRCLRNIKVVSNYLKNLKKYPHAVDISNISSLLKNADEILEKYKTILEDPNDSQLPTTQSRVGRKRKPESLSLNGSQKKSRKIKNSYKIGRYEANTRKVKHNTNRRRRTRCRVCDACRTDDCGYCSYCKDMTKFGGNGRAKQSCLSRQCLQPVLPSNSICLVCNTSVRRNVNSKLDVMDENLLMECSLCYEIVHPKCVFDKMAATGCESYHVANNINNDLPNSWKCPKCYAEKEKDEIYFNKLRFFKARYKMKGSVESNITQSAHSHL